MLAIPGVTSPASRPQTTLRPPVAAPIAPGTSASASSLDALPLPSDFPTARSPADVPGFPLGGSRSSSSLDDLSPRTDLPALRRPSTGAAIARPGAATNPAGESIPLTIEPLDEAPSNARSSAGRPAAPRSMTGRDLGDRSATSVKPDAEPISPRPAPRRAPGLLGRLFGPPPAPLPPPRDEPRTDDKARMKRESSSEAGLDPDVVARRRIERQISATLGDKVRSFDVSVTGRNVVIFAEPSRFWLRRTVRRSLETLPILQGYRSRIDVGE